MKSLNPVELKLQQEDLLEVVNPLELTADFGSNVATYYSVQLLLLLRGGVTQPADIEKVNTLFMTTLYN